MTVSGLAGSALVLQNNGGDDLSISADGDFTFATALLDGSAYSVTVLTQPGGQLCEVTSGAGTVSGANVAGVTVSCGSPVRIDEFSVSAGLVSAGDMVTLTWDTVHASSCIIDPGDLAASPQGFGMLDVLVVEGTTFTLTCHGLGEPVQRIIDVEVTGEDWAQVSAGWAHTCAVKNDGRLFCWGHGGTGRLGNDSTAVSLVPVQEFTGATDWAEVSAGDYHTCAVKTDGRLFCWGYGEALGLRSVEQAITGALTLFTSFRLEGKAASRLDENLRPWRSASAFNVVTRLSD